MALDRRDIEMIKETVNKSQKFTPKTKFNELLLQSGITLIGIALITLIVSVIAWGISYIWNQIL
jgi:hypothetical protein